MNARSRIVMLVLGLSAVIIAALSGSKLFDPQSLAASALEKTPTSVEGNIANCRYGATPIGPGQTQTIDTLGAGWYLNFNHFPDVIPPANDADFMHIITVREDSDFIEPDKNKNCESPEHYQWLGTYTIQPALNNSYANYLKNNPGQKYTVGNEVERACQGHMNPEIYADAYHEIYHFIKSYDPTAQIAISGLVQVTPNRLDYLDKVWKAYNERHGSDIPVDIWAMHLYIMPELMANGVSPNNIASVGIGTNFSLGIREAGGNAALCNDAGVYCLKDHDSLQKFDYQVYQMRQWMANHGQRNKPLLITEYSILYPYEYGNSCFKDELGNCFDQQRVTNFMQSTFDYLNSRTDSNLGYPLDNNKMIQQWMWFAVNSDGVGSASNLVESDLSTLTMVGNKFKNYVANEALYQNLIVDEVADVAVATNGAALASAKISVTFRNNGNDAITQPFTVTFYKNANLTVVIDSVTINPKILGCASHAYTATTTWHGLSKGTYNYYVKLDSSQVIAESPTGNVDNIGSGSVTVYSNQVNLPVVRGAN